MNLGREEIYVFMVDLDCRAAETITICKALFLQLKIEFIHIFTILIFPIREHGMFLHLFVSSLIFHCCFIVFLY